MTMFRNYALDGSGNPYFTLMLLCIPIIGLMAGRVRKAWNIHRGECHGSVLRGNVNRSFQFR